MSKPAGNGWIQALKIAIVVAALGYLVGTGKLRLSDLTITAGNWPLVLGAGATILGVMLVSFFRYWLLLKALGLTFRLGQIVRIGFVGAFFNTFMLGGLGGDAVKLAYLLRGTRNRAGIVASVMVDRVLGLLGLLTLGGVALFLSWEEVLATPTLHNLSLAVFGVLGGVGCAAIVSFVALAKGRRAGFGLWGALLLLLGGLTLLSLREHGAPVLVPAPTADAEAVLRGRALLVLGLDLLVALACVIVVPSCQPGRRLEGFVRRRIPLGGHLMSLMQAILTYRNRFGTLVGCFALSALLQGMALLALFVCTQALPLDPHPGLAHVFFAGPPAFIANVLPVPGGGLGVGEVAFDQLLSLCRVHGQPITQGAAAFLLYRFWLIAVGLVGLVFYLQGRKEIRAAEEAYLAEESPICEAHDV